MVLEASREGQEVVPEGEAQAWAVPVSELEEQAVVVVAAVAVAERV